MTIYTGNPDADYKIEQLELMLECETRNDENSGYGAHLSHWYGNAKEIRLDEDAIRALINYYKTK